MKTPPTPSEAAVAAAFALASRVAALNPAAGEIGAGMLAQLVADAAMVEALRNAGDAA